ncbi:MAG: YkgJ family cysteine cluster protein [Candidatus Hydrothermarchaeales archaeon]
MSELRKVCHYCGERIKKKELIGHFATAHSIGARDKEEFACLDGCVRCCADEGMPLELTLGDLMRISNYLDVSMEKLFDDYCQLMWNRIPNTPYFIPSTGLVFPCGFLKEEECVVYDVRPLHCRLFPENILTSNFEDLSPVKGRGYQCVDKEFTISMDRADAVRNLSEIDQRELEATAEYFENINYSIPISDEEYGQIMSAVEGLDEIEKNAKKRAFFMEVLNKRIGLDDLKKVFVDKIKKLDGDKDLKKFSLFEV